METLVLGWYVMVHTGSVLLLTAFGSLQYVGTLAGPMFGVLGDRLGGRTMLCAMRAIYAALAALLTCLALAGVLTPVWVLVLAALAGVVRPNDLVMRNSLIGETIPPEHLMGALGLSRATMDSARIAGALAGAGLSTALGVGSTYLFVTSFYVASLALTFGVSGRRPRVADPAVSSPALRHTRPVAPERPRGGRGPRPEDAGAARHDAAGVPGQPDRLPGVERAPAVRRAADLPRGCDGPRVAGRQLRARRSRGVGRDRRDGRPTTSGARDAGWHGRLVRGAPGLRARGEPRPGAGDPPDRRIRPERRHDRHGRDPARRRRRGLSGTGHGRADARRLRPARGARGLRPAHRPDRLSLDDHGGRGDRPASAPCSSGPGGAPASGRGRQLAGARPPARDHAWATASPGGPPSACGRRGIPRASAGRPAAGTPRRT